MPAPTVKVMDDFSQGDAFKIKVSHNPAFDIQGVVWEVFLSAVPGGDPILDISYTTPADADAAAGVAYIPVTTADTEVIQPGKYWASLKRTLVSEEPKTILRTGKRTSDGSVVGKVEVFENLDTTP